MFRGADARWWGRSVSLSGSYFKGGYGDLAAFEALNTQIEALAKDQGADNRIFFLSVPPFVFGDVCKCIKEKCESKNGARCRRARVVHGRDRDGSVAKREWQAQNSRGRDGRCPSVRRADWLWLRSRAAECERMTLLPAHRVRCEGMLPTTTTRT